MNKLKTTTVVPVPDNVDNGNSADGQQTVGLHADITALNDPEALLRARQDVRAATGNNATSLVEYRSTGQCLIIAAASDVESRDKALACASRLTESTRDTAETADSTRLSLAILCPLDQSLADDTSDRQITDSGIKIFYRNLHKVSGHLGQFDVLVTRADPANSPGDRDANGGNSNSLEHLGVTAFTESGLFDLILDLRSTDQQELSLTDSPATVAARLPPFGYYRAPDQVSLDTAMQELPQMIGEFEKPKYFQYDASICAHSRSTLDGCNNCLDVCATSAIQSDDEGVKIDPYLCQGCGHCASVCPSGAMTYAYPKASDAIARSRELLGKQTVQSSVLLLHAVNEDATGTLEQFENQLPDHVIALAVEEPGAYGIDYWATMIASGVKRIVVLLEPVGSSNSGDASELIRGPGKDALLSQAAMLNTILVGTGFPADTIQIVDSAHAAGFAAGLAEPAAVPAYPAATFATHNDKRQTLRQALDHLSGVLTVADATVQLPAESPFGKINIRADDCTLCMACVTTCPAGALLDGHSVPQLKFVEANCVQCGLCEQACPENVLEREPRYLYDSVSAREHQILNEEEPFNCLRCHKPFGTAK